MDTKNDIVEYLKNISEIREKERNKFLTDEEFRNYISSNFSKFIKVDNLHYVLDAHKLLAGGYRVGYYLDSYSHPKEDKEFGK